MFQDFSFSELAISLAVQKHASFMPNNKIAMTAVQVFMLFCFMKHYNPLETAVKA